MDVDMDQWHDLALEKPRHGEIIEVLVWKPAQSLGENALGYVEFRTFDELSYTVYWRISSDPKVYRYVQQKLHENH